MCLAQGNPARASTSDHDRGVVLTMKALLRIPLLALALAVATACGPRQVEVRTAPTTSTEPAVQVTNNLSQAVNVYVTPSGSGELFLRQIPANTVERVPVAGVSSGSNV